MVSTIQPTSALATNLLVTGTDQARKQGDAQTRGDMVTISGAARNRQAQAQAVGNTWESRFALKEGTTTLSNGHKVVVTFEGSSMELLEYKGSELVKKITGDLKGSTATLETEYYDEAGEISQTISTTFGTGDLGAASVSRHVTWFEDGEKIREMSESMVVMDNKSGRSALKSLTAARSADMATLVDQISSEDNSTSYRATVKGYTNGELTMDMEIMQRGRYVNSVNRSDETVNGMAPHSTEEAYQDSTLSIVTHTYDVDGNKLYYSSLRQTMRNGKKDDDGTFGQDLTVEWYDKDGEVLKRDTSTLRIWETEGAPLPEGTSMLDMLGISEADFAAETPMTPTDMLTGDVLATASEGGDLFHNIVQVDPSLVGGISQGRDDGSKYVLGAESTIYRDGEVVALTADSEHTTVNTLAGGQGFRTGGGLTEDRTPGFLRGTRHMDMAFENGMISSLANLQLEELVRQDSDGPDQIQTRITGAEGFLYPGSFTTKDLEPERTITRTVDGFLEKYDPEAKKASRTMDRALKVSLGALARVFDSI